MSFGRLLILICCLGASLPVLGCAAKRDKPSISFPTVDEQVRRLTPGLTLTFWEPHEGEDSGPYGVRRFSYGIAPSWPYGEGFAVWARESNAVLWVYLHHGDYSPHEVRWADFDGDGNLDIFFHAGFEEVSTTHVYLNRVAANTFGVSRFALAYESNDVHSVVLDFEGDGRPELLVPEPYPTEDEIDACWPEFRAFERSRPELRDEYRRLASGFDAFNFKFGFPADEIDGDILFLFDKIRVERVGEPADSEQLREHLRWRVRILTDARARTSAGCQERVTTTIGYLEAMLQRRQPWLPVGEPESRF